MKWLLSLVLFAGAAAGAFAQAENEEDTRDVNGHPVLSPAELQRKADAYGVELQREAEAIRADRELVRAAQDRAAGRAATFGPDERKCIDQQYEGTAEGKKEADEGAFRLRGVEYPGIAKCEAEAEAKKAVVDKAARDKRLRTARAAHKARDEREATQVALDAAAAMKLDEQHQQELKQLRAYCSAVYIRTADKKVSDLTVRETQFVQACQGVGQYPPK